MSCVKDAVLKASQAWQFFQPEHLKAKDANPADLLHIAETIRSVCNLVLGNNCVIGKSQVITIVELVENEVMAKSAVGIRNTTGDHLTHHLTSVGKKFFSKILTTQILTQSKIQS